MSKIYSVRKRCGQWAVCSDESVMLRFETYDEAVSTARDAWQVLTQLPPNAIKSLSANQDEPAQKSRGSNSPGSSAAKPATIGF
jgi:hypothetical protein